MNLLSLIDPISTLLDKVVEDKDQRNALAHEIATLSTKQAHEIALQEIEVNKQQIEVNKEEAKGNFWQSGWRPAVGWVCVSGFAVNFLISPLVAAVGVHIPQSDTGTMIPVLVGLLGIGGMRSLERLKGVGK